MTDTDETKLDIDEPDAPEADEEDQPAGDPFEGWPAAESAAVIEDIPADVSVEHVRGEVEVPDGYTVLEGAPLGNKRSVGVVVLMPNRLCRTLENQRPSLPYWSLNEGSLVGLRTSNQAGSFCLVW